MAKKGQKPETKATAREDGDIKRRKQQSADEEDNNKGRRKSADEEGDATTTISQRGGDNQGDGYDKGKNKKGENKTMLLAAEDCPSGC